MPARLKSFELHGYKTFASKTEFIFADGVTAIVGPNGSGKSNIADCIRWVLGEQSFGLLRAKRTEDMIFAGSENRQRAGMASATIVFDNSDGWLPIDFAEVGITRRAYRDGDNEYLLNGQRVRLRDVSELLAQSGLAERTYTVIGQGLVDAALSLKAEERRRLFEEAAGIGLHRGRREEALRRLESTRRNLERVQDILAELQPRLRSLERQARKAQEYDQARQDLKVLLLEWYGYHWHQSQAEVTELVEIVRQREAGLDKARSEHNDLENKFSALREQSKQHSSIISDINGKLSAAYSQKEKITREQAVAEERSRSLINRRTSLESEIVRLESDSSLFKDLADKVAVEIESLHSEIAEAGEHKQNAELELEKYRVRIRAIEAEIARERHDLSELTTRQTLLAERLHERETVVHRNEIKLHEITLEHRSATENVISLQRSLDEVNSQLRNEEKQLGEMEKSLRASNDAISQGEAQRREILDEQIDINTRLTRQQSQLDVLRQAEDSLSGYADGARLLLQAIRGPGITGARGALSSYVEVPEKYENAISSALGEYLSALVVRDWNGVESALDILDKGSTRGAMLPLAALAQTKPWVVDMSKVPDDDDGIVGIASELVRVADEFKTIIDVLLGHVVVVKNRGVAQRLISARRWPAYPVVRFVTLKGDIYYSNGPVLSSFSGQNILARPRQRRELEDGISTLRSEADRIAAALADEDEKLKVLTNVNRDLSKVLELSRAQSKVTQAKVRDLESKLDKAQRAYAWQEEQLARITSDLTQGREETARINEELTSLDPAVSDCRKRVQEKLAGLAALSEDDVQKNVSYWQMQLAVAERARKDADLKQKDRLETLERTENALASVGAQIQDLEANRLVLEGERRMLDEGLTTIMQEIDRLNTLLLPEEHQLRVVENTINQWVSLDTEARQVLSLAEHQHAQARINLSKRQDALDSLRRRIEDDFGLVAFEYADSVTGQNTLPIDGMVEELPRVKKLAPDMDENVQRQRALLRRMGPVNPDAQLEYQQVKDRFAFMNEQVSDLHKAETDIQEVIVELDLLMEREFRKTFDAVAQEFRKIFTRLFGGGSARLILTDPEFMTDTGIDIEARLPGRREQGLSLLSGGERSLTAAALVFALLRISPTPFCILDEVDAMLDEANVGRFRELLLELSANTQFIIITHNRNTVQAAGVIYGVTMGRDSASQVISLKLDELTEEFGVQRT